MAAANNQKKTTINQHVLVLLLFLLPMLILILNIALILSIALFLILFGCAASSRMGTSM